MINRIAYYFYGLYIHLLRHLIVILIACLLTCTADAQVRVAAAKRFDAAMRLRLKKQDSAAYAMMHSAINLHNSYTDAYSMLGQWYYTDRLYNKAVDVFVQAGKYCENGRKAFAMPLARSLLFNYKPEQALQLIVSNMNEKDAAPEWKTLHRQAMFMRTTLNNALKDTVFNLGVRVNTPYPEMHPSISSDTMELYFTRMVNNVDMDCYKTTVDSCGGWFSGGNLGAPTNTPNHEAAQSISADGHYLFFMRCDNRSRNGWDQGGCDLYMAYTPDSIWTNAQSFGATINTPAYEGMPCLSPDNRDLYFVSDKEGGYGGLDIWVSRFENGLWQLPRNLGPEVNTAGNETAPFIHIDNRTLYFSSNGLTGMGGSDLFYCRRTGDTTWSKPKNMGYPINTTANEESISITIDGKRAYIASDRDSLEGNYDIYETKMPIYAQPVPVAVIKGYAYDSLTKEKLTQAAVKIHDAQTGEYLYRFVSNRGDGSYMITLPIGKKYTYTADRVNYSEMTDTISLIGVEANVSEHLEKNIPLLPYDYLAPINDSLIATLHFELNSTELTDSANAQLQDAITPWLYEAGYTILVNGFTDNTGTPIINIELSTKRAALIGEILTSYGIDPLNIILQGYGEINPIASNDTETGRNINRRVEIIIRR